MLKIFALAAALLGCSELLERAADTSLSGSRVSGLWSQHYPNLAERYEQQPFTLQVLSNKYLIAVESVDPRSPFYMVSTSDGCDSFGINYPNTWKKPGVLEPVASDQRPSLGVVNSGTFPSYQESIVQALWLAYCYPLQNEHLINETTNRYPFKALLRDTLAAYTDFILRVEMSTNGTRATPRRIAFYHPGKGVMKGTTNRYALAESAYTNGYLAAEFVVERFRQVEGSLLPAAGVFREYAIKQNGIPQNSDDVTLKCETSLVATEIMANDELPLETPFVVPGARTVINDYRLKQSDGRPFGFRLQSKPFMKSTSDAFAATRKQLETEARSKVRARWLFPLAFVIILVPGIVLLLRLVKRSRTSVPAA